jgi:hypothetical protein
MQTGPVALVAALLCFGCGEASARRSDTPAPTALAAPANAVASPAPVNAEPTPAPENDSPRPAPTTGTRATDVHEVTLPAGTHLPIVLETPVGSTTSRVKQPVRAHLTRAIVIKGHTVVPRGSRVSGIVTSVKRAGGVKGRAQVALRFDTLTVRNDDRTYKIDTALVGRTARATTGEDALEVAVPAAGGAVAGAIVGGKEGAAIGAAAGAGGGTAVVLSTRGKEVRIRKGASLRLRLTAPVTISGS